MMANLNSMLNSIDLLTTFNDENFRLVSLASWTNLHVSKQKLARFGFYYVLQHDHVKCHFCEVVIGDWGIGDDPLTEHYRHSPKCPLINMEPTDNIPSGNPEDFHQELSKLNKTNSIIVYSNNSFNKHEIHTPRHPDYADIEKRLQSFTNWPKSLKQTPDDLSEAGFFYLGVGDEVKCFHCAGCLKDWEPNDIGLEEHKKHFETKCGFIILNYQKLKKQISTKSTPKELVKATPIQIKSLIDYMNQNTDLRDGKVNSANNKENYIEMWEKLVNYLNKLDGPKKTIKAWREVWRNHKYNKKRKPSMTTTTVEIEDIYDVNFKQEPVNNLPIFYYENIQDSGQIKTIPKKRKYNETSQTMAEKISYLVNFMEKNPGMQQDLLNRTGFTPEWINLVNILNTGSEEKSADDWANIWRNKHYETILENSESPAEHTSTIHHQQTPDITSYDGQLILNENLPMAKVLPKKRKLQEYSKENEMETITEYKIESDLMEMKYKNLEFEKMQLEIENQKKQLEIEKLKMQLEFAETKRQLEIQKDELEKEKNRLALERTSILIPIQSNFE